MKAIPQIQKYMTYVPDSIDANSSVKEANKIMQAKGFRHLPVEKGGKLFGILTDKDIKSIMAFAGADPQNVKVGDLCEENPFEVSPSSKIDEVAEVMAEKKIGSALVVDNGKLVGIFTVIDALQALADISRARFHA